MINNQETGDKKLAVLIDADNVPYSYVKEMLEEIARYGTPTVKRIYADWTQSSVSGWKACLLQNSITPIQQYSYTYGKNSTDSALIIDAMDILYADKVDGFCIVSSDSDFTRLATRLREAGKTVIGIGEKKTPQPFITACDRFVYLENLKPEKQPTEEVKADKKKSGTRSGSIKSSLLPSDVISLLLTAADSVADESGWAFLADVGNLIMRQNPAFDSRSYGFNKLSKLIYASNLFEIDVRETGKSHVNHVYIRQKISRDK